MRKMRQTVPCSRLLWILGAWPLCSALCLLLARSSSAVEPNVTGTDSPSGLAISATTPENMSYFTRRVQPILFNSCAGSGCHSADSRTTSFVLTRPVGAHMQTPALTRQNLLQVLAAIDMEAPEHSPLLIKAIQAHGGARRPPLAGPHAAAYRILDEWVKTVACAKPDPRRVSDGDLLISESSASSAAKSAFAEDQQTAPARPADGQEAPSPFSGIAGPSESKPSTSSPDSTPAAAGNTGAPQTRAGPLDLLKRLFARPSMGGDPIPGLGSFLRRRSAANGFMPGDIRSFYNATPEAYRPRLPTGAAPDLPGGQIVGQSRPPGQSQQPRPARPDPFDPRIFNTQRPQK